MAVEFVSRVEDGIGTDTLTDIVMLNSARVMELLVGAGDGLIAAAVRDRTKQKESRRRRTCTVKFDDFKIFNGAISRVVKSIQKYLGL